MPKKFRTGIDDVAEAKLAASGWPNPLDKLLIYHAVSLEAEEVTLSNGKLFRIKYLYSGDMIRISPLKELVPMGYFNLRDVRDWGEDGSSTG